MVTETEAVAEPPAPVQVIVYVFVVESVSVITLVPEVSIASLQSPEALHEVASVEDQVNVKDSSTSTVEALDEIVAVGSGGGLVTVTETLSDAEPPAPVQVIVYVFVPALVSVIALVPEVPIASLQSPEAEHEVAFVEDQVRLNSILTSTELTLEDKETVGAGGVVGPPPTGLVSPPPPPPPPHAVKINTKITERFFIYIQLLYINN